MKSVFLLLYTVYRCLVPLLLLLLSQFLPFCEVPGVAHFQQPGKPVWYHCVSTSWSDEEMGSLCFARGVVQNECQIIYQMFMVWIDRTRKGNQNWCNIRLQGKWARCINLWPCISFQLQRKLFVELVKKLLVSVVHNLKSENGNRYLRGTKDFFFIACINIPSLISYCIFVV